MDRTEGKSKTTYWEIFETGVNTINHVLIGSGAIYMTGLVCSLKYNLFNLHVIFTCLGYQLLMAEAILALYSKNSWTGMIQRRSKSVVHVVLQVIGAAFALTGVGIELYLKNWKFKWNKNHTIFGFLSIIFLIANIIVGLATLYSTALRRWIRPVCTKCLHNLLGLITFIFGMVALYYGYETRFMLKNVNSNIRTYLAYVALITCIITSVGALKNLYYNTRDLIKVFLRNRKLAEEDSNSDLQK